MAEERIDSLFDIPAVKKEFEEVLGMLEKLGLAIKGINNPQGAGAVGASLAEKKAAMKDLQAQTEMMIAVEKKLEAQVEATTAAAKEAVAANGQSVASIKAYNGTLDENIKLQIQYKSQLADIKQRQAELKKSFTGTGEAVKVYEERMHSLVRQEKELQTANLELNTIIRNQVKEMNAAGNSLNEMRARLNQLKAAADNMDIGSAEFAEAQKQIVALNNDIKALEFARGDFQRNVGNYAGSFSSAFNVLQGELTETRTKMQQLQAEGKESSAAFEQLAREEKLLAELTGGLNKAFSSTKQEFRALQEAAKKMGIEFGATNETFQKFVQEVGGAKDQIGDLDAIIKQNASDTQFFDGLIAAAQGLAGAYGVASGAAELFGENNEDLQKKLVKFMAVMQILQGLQALQNMLQKEGAAIQTLLAIRTGLVTAATKVYTFVTAQATAATIALRSAIMSTGIGAILVLIGLFISKMAEAATTIRDNIKALKDYDAALENVKTTLEGDLTIIDLNLKRNTERVKQRAGSEQEIANLTKKSLQEQITAYGKTARDITILEDELQRDRLRLIKKGGKDAEEEIKKLDDQAMKLRQERNNANANMVKASFELELETERAKTKAAEDGRKSQKARSEARIVDLEREADALNATAGDEKKSLAERLAALDAFYAKQKDISKAKGAVELSQPNLTAGERAKIQAEQKREMEKLGREYNAAREKLMREGASRRLEIELEILKMEQEIVKKKNAALVDNENLSLETRLKAQENFVNAERKIIEAEYNAKKQNAKGNKDELLLIEKEYENRLLTLTIDSNDKITQVIRDYTEQQKAIKESARQTEISFWQDIAAMIEADATKAYAKDIIALNNALKKKEISLTQYNERRKKIEDDFAEKAIRNEIKNAKKLLELAPDGSAEKFNLQKKIAELEMQLDDKVTQKKIDNRQRLKDAEKQLANEVVNLISSVVLGGYDKQKNAVQDQIDMVEKQKAAEIDRITASTLSEQEKADKIKIIEAKAVADKEALERRKREIDLQKAKFERTKTILEIASNTAIAIIKSVAASPLTGGMPFSAIAGAIGAAQIAAVLARPLPKFEKGTSSAPEGWAITDEKGPEMYVEPGGKTFMGSDKGPTLRYLKRGTKVIPHDQVNKTMLDAMIVNTSRSVEPREDLAAKEIRGVRDMLYWQTSELVKAQKKQRPASVKVNIYGDWKAYIDKAVRE